MKLPRMSVLTEKEDHDRDRNLLLPADTDFIFKSLQANFAQTHPADRYYETLFYHKRSHGATPPGPLELFIPSQTTMATSTTGAVSEKSGAVSPVDTAEERVLGRMPPFNARGPRVTLAQPPCRTRKEHLSARLLADLQTLSATEQCSTLLMDMDDARGLLRFLPPADSGAPVTKQTMMNRVVSCSQSLITILGSSDSILLEMSALPKGISLFSRLLRTATADGLLNILRPLLLHLYFHAALVADTIETRAGPATHAAFMHSLGMALSAAGVLDPSLLPQVLHLVVQCDPFGLKYSNRATVAMMLSVLLSVASATSSAGNAAAAAAAPTTAALSDLYSAAEPKLDLWVSSRLALNMPHFSRAVWALLLALSQTVPLERRRGMLMALRETLSSHKTVWPREVELLVATCTGRSSS